MRIVLTPLLLLMSVFGAAQNLPDWENPDVIGINKLPYHVTLGNPSTHSTNPQITYLTVGYDVSSWDDIHVPCDWQMQGFGTPIYTNSRYPFRRSHPSVTGTPDRNWTAYENRNPVGSYVTVFNASDIKTVIRWAVT